MRTASKRGKFRWAQVLSILPGGFWQLLFVFLPLIAVLVISFLSRGEYGNTERPFTLENYKRLAGFGLFGFEPVYPIILLRTVLLAVVTSLVCALCALPLAFFISRLRGRVQMMALILLTIPVWTNLLVRTYGWQVLLAPEGLISKLAASLRLIDPGEALYPSVGAVLLCLICDYLPFAALPLFASIEKLDHILIEAAQDLGASRWNIFRHAILPQIQPGLWAGIIFVFLPALGQFVVPDLLGGAKTVLLGNVLQQQFGASRDWPFGSALAAASILLIFLGLVLYTRRSGKEMELL
jgi:spermidine/putrescine transport system permease protein